MSGTPLVELLVIGDELMSGRTLDTNSTWLCLRLARIGLVPRKVTRTGDDPDEIEFAIESSAFASDLLLVVGGMGPTIDDRTLEVAAATTGLELTQHPPTRRKIARRFVQQGRRMPKTALRQARVVKGARLFPNPAGLVPGMAFGYEGCLVVLLPGVPAELKGIMASGLEDFISGSFPARTRPAAMVRTTGLPEAVIAARLGRLAKQHQAELAFYPGTRGVDVVISASSSSRQMRARRAVVKRLGEYVYEVGERGIEEVLGEVLRQRRLKLATAESCTGGLIAARITDVAGSSDYFLGSVVSYDNAVKTRSLGVRSATLERHGAVSAATVREMAAGVCRQLGAEVGIAVSGIAGPGGGTKQKPVGLVYVGAAVRGRMRTQKHFFAGTRQIIRERAAMAGMDLCRRMLTGGQRK